jgi:hypothetical protein
MIITQDILQSNSKALVDFTFNILADKNVGNSFITAFQDFAPNLKSDIASSVVNPNCSCRGRVSDYIQTNISSYSEFFINYFTSNNLLQQISDLYYANLAKIPVELSGKVAQTTISEWANFASKIKPHDFKGFSVVKEGDVVYVFFI